MASVLKIYSAYGGTVDFINDSAYRLLSWSPAVATRRANILGGRGPYADVVETMRIFIGGADVLSKLTTLTQLMEQAERWSKGEDVNPVILQIQATSTSPLLEAIIHGPPAPGEPTIELPGNFADAPVLSAIDNLTLQFKRSGLWLKLNYSPTTSSSAANPSALTVTLPTAPSADSPYDISLTNMPWSESVVWNSYVLATSADTAANAAKKLFIIEAESMALGIGTPSSVSDTTNKARGDSVLRFTFASAGNLDSNPVDVSATAHTSIRRWSLFASCRTNSTTTSFQVKVGIGSDSRYSWGRPVTVAADQNDGNPFWLYLGQVALPSRLKQVALNVVSDGSGTIDFDSLAILASDSAITSSAVAIPAQSQTAATLGATRKLSINHAMHFGIHPFVYILDGTKEHFQNYSGNPVFIAGVNEPGLAVAWLACGRYNEAYWRATNTSGTVLSNQLEAICMNGQVAVT